MCRLAHKFNDKARKCTIYCDMACTKGINYRRLYSHGFSILPRSIIFAHSLSDFGCLLTFTNSKRVKWVLLSSYSEFSIDGV